MNLLIVTLALPLMDRGTDTLVVRGTIKTEIYILHVKFGLIDDRQSLLI